MFVSCYRKPRIAMKYLDQESHVYSHDMDKRTGKIIVKQNQPSLYSTPLINHTTILTHEFNLFWTNQAVSEERLKHPAIVNFPE